MEKLSEEQMWEVIDGMATPEIMNQHETLMGESQEYKEEFEKYNFLNEQLLKLDLEMPSMRFTENVLDNVLSLKSGVKRKDRTPLIYMILTGTFSILMMLMVWPNSTNKISSDLKVNTEGVTTILSNPILTYTFIILNIILLFIIIDKKVLKPYFDKRIK